MKYKIGYVDEDPIQVSKYERKLRSHFEVIGYNISKGTQLIDLLDEIYNSDIDLLMVDYLMVDKGIVTFNGDEVVRKFEEIKPTFPIIIFTNEESQAFPQVDNPNIIYDKSLVTSDLPKLVEILIKNIVIYQNYIKKRKDTIAILLEKSTKGTPLSSKEQHELLENQLELTLLDKREIQEVPLQLLDHQRLEDLSNIKKEAESYLESLLTKK